MGYTYDSTLADDVSLVRFHIGDNNERGHYLEDGEITYWLTSNNGSVGASVRACILYIMSRLSQPDFHLDWMSVSNAQAREGFRKLLIVKCQEFGLSVSGVLGGTRIATAHRVDSYELNSDGTYNPTDGTP
jgi:hypothetical protein